eukprot:9163389-Pyramimonas_sp.AAC.1
MQSFALRNYQPKRMVRAARSESQAADGMIASLFEMLPTSSTLSPNSSSSLTIRALRDTSSTPRWNWAPAVHCQPWLPPGDS